MVVHIERLIIELFNRLHSGMFELLMFTLNAIIFRNERLIIVC